MLLIGFLLLLSAQDGFSQLIVGFSARLNTSLTNTPSETKVIYEEASANVGNWYNTATGDMNVPSGYQGMYYVSLSIGIPDDENARCSIGVYGDESRKFAGLRFDNAASSGVEYASRGYIRNVGTDYSLQVITEGTSSLLGNPHYTTSWTMFRYSQQTEYTVAFSTARRSQFSGVAESIPWQQIFVNDGGPESGDPFNQTSGFFLAPVSGYYFFSMSAMSVEQQPMQAVFHRWEPGSSTPQIFCALNRTATTAMGMDTTGRSILMGLNEGDQVAVGNAPGSVLGSTDSGFETSFSGFLYALDDEHSDIVIAFFAYMEDWSITGTSAQVLGDWFGTTVNVPNGSEAPFNVTSGIFTAPRDGTYFFSFSVGVAVTSTVDLFLTDDQGNDFARIERRNNFLNGIDTLFQNVVVVLTTGHAVYLEFGSGSSNLHSSPYGRETSFMGMRLR